jgi:hypothetical protein
VIFVIHALGFFGAVVRVPKHIRASRVSADLRGISIVSAAAVAVFLREFEEAPRFRALVDALTHVGGARLAVIWATTRRNVSGANIGGLAVCLAIRANVTRTATAVLPIDGTIGVPLATALGRTLLSRQLHARYVLVLRETQQELWVPLAPRLWAVVTVLAESVLFTSFNLVFSKARTTRVRNSITDRNPLAVVWAFIFRVVLVLFAGHLVA